MLIVTSFIKVNGDTVLTYKILKRKEKFLV